VISSDPNQEYKTKSFLDTSEFFVLV